ncbi:MAG: cytochrome c biogenesis protein CcdA [Firmicutes bacterium]|nr:cytochrome c biogenesis protein CcdA [Bacillota bacterium]
MEIPVKTPNLLVALAAGVLSFLSPCVLPVYPSYLSYLTGLSAAELAAGGPEARRQVLRHGAMFVLGFSVIWVALGLGTTVLAYLFRAYQETLRWMGGLLVMAMGLTLLGVLRIPFFMRERRLQLARRPSGYLGSFVVGIAFAAGWTPCIGPILTAVLVLAEQNPGQGVPLLAAYSLGFAVPFLLLAYGLGSARWLARYSGMVERVGGALMVVMGFLLVTGQLQRLISWLIALTPGGFTGF